MVLTVPAAGLATPRQRAPDPELDPEDSQRFARYADARAFWRGDQWQSRIRRGDRRLTFNYARTLIRKVASYALSKPVTFSIPDSAAAEKDLNDLLDELDAPELDLSLLVEASMIGDAAIKTTWSNDEKRPLIAPVDPAQLLAWADPANRTRLYRVRHAYMLLGAAIAPTFGADQVDTTGLNALRFYPVLEDWTDDRWQVTIAGQPVIDRANPYGWIPYSILHNDPRAGALWGSSDLADLYDPCRELNSRLTTLSKILEMSGAPIAVLEGVDSSEGLTRQPGAKWEIPAESKAYLLDLLASQGWRLHVDYVEQLRLTLHDLAETPRTAFGDTGRPLSGAALEVEIQPLVQKVNRKRQQLKPFYRRRNQQLLSLMEQFGQKASYGQLRTLPIWPSILPSDREADARIGAQLVASQIRSRRSVAADLGEEDPDAEMLKISEEITQLAAALPATAASSDPVPGNENGRSDPGDRQSTDDDEEDTPDGD